MKTAAEVRYFKFINFFVIMYYWVLINLLTVEVDVEAGVVKAEVKSAS